MYHFWFAECRTTVGQHCKFFDHIIVSEMSYIIIYDREKYDNEDRLNGNQLEYESLRT